MDEIRLVIIGGGVLTDDARRELTSMGIRVVAEVSRADAVDVDAAVVLARDETSLRSLIDAREAEGLPAIVVQSADAGLSGDLREAGAPGWAIVPADSSNEVLAAAIVAAANGMAVQPVADAEPIGNEDEGDEDRLTRLTVRERDVLELVSQGLPNKTIAARLGISDQTVKFHLSSIFSKLGVSSRTEAVRQGLRSGLIHL